MFSDGKGTLDIKTSGDDGFESPLDFLVEHVFLDYEITKYAFLDFFRRTNVTYLKSYLCEHFYHNPEFIISKIWPAIYCLFKHLLGMTPLDIEG